jgi:HAMP domain-containing protein
MKSINVSTKITILILAVSLVAVAAISFFSYDYHLKSNQEKYTATLNSLADNRAAYLNTYFEKAAIAVEVLKNSETIKKGDAAASGGGMDMMAMMGAPDATAAPDSTLASEPTEGGGLTGFLEEQKYIFEVDDIIITSPTGAVVASTDPNVKGNFIDPDGITFERAKNDIHFTSVFRDKTKKNYFSYAAGAVTTNSGSQQLIIVKLNLNPAYKALKNYHGLGQTGELLLGRVDPTSRKIAIVSPLRGDTSSAIILYNPNEQFVRSFADAVDGKSIPNTGKDLNGNPILQTARKVGKNMALIAKMDLAEAHGDAEGLITTFTYAGLCIVALAVFLAMLFSRSLTRPLYAMRNTISLVAQGVLPENSEQTSSDEFGQMGTKVNELVHTLRGNAEFAKRIGEGKYDTAFKPASENDILGLSLIDMRNNLIENERRDKERNWIVRGVAEISEILRMHDSIDALGEDVIKFILEKIGAIQGAF